MSIRANDITISIPPFLKYSYPWKRGSILAQDRDKIRSYRDALFRVTSVKLSLPSSHHTPLNVSRPGSPRKTLISVRSVSNETTSERFRSRVLPKRTPSSLLLLQEMSAPSFRPSPSCLDRLVEKRKKETWNGFFSSFDS